MAGFFISALMPWPRNSITYQIAGGTIVTSTITGYQHPARVAIAVAILLPLWNEFYR